MKRMRSLLLLIAIAVAPPALAQCEIPANQGTGGLSPEKLALRSAIYQEMCRRVGGELIDTLDLDVAKRLVFPKRIRNDAAPTEALADAITKLKAPVVLVYITEPNGKTSWAAVLESSGNERVDAAAVAMAKATYFRDPATLDGKPVRLFQNMRVFGPIPK